MTFAYSLFLSQNVPAAEEANEEVHTPLQQTGARGGGRGGGEEEVEEPDYAIPPDAGQVMIRVQPPRTWQLHSTPTHT